MIDQEHTFGYLEDDGFRKYVYVIKYFHQNSFQGLEVFENPAEATSAAEKYVHGDDIPIERFEGADYFTVRSRNPHLGINHETGHKGTDLIWKLATCSRELIR